MRKSSNSLTSVAISTTWMVNLQKAKELTEIPKQKIVEKALSLIGINDQKLDERTLKRVLGLAKSSSSIRSRRPKSRSCIA